MAPTPHASRCRTHAGPTSQTKCRRIDGGPARRRFEASGIGVSLRAARMAMPADFVGHRPTDLSGQVAPPFHGELRPMFIASAPWPVAGRTRSYDRATKVARPAARRVAASPADARREPRCPFVPALPTSEPPACYSTPAGNADARCEPRRLSVASTHQRPRRPTVFNAFFANPTRRTARNHHGELRLCRCERAGHKLRGPAVASRHGSFRSECDAARQHALSMPRAELSRSKIFVERHAAVTRRARRTCGPMTVSSPSPLRSDIRSAGSVPAELQRAGHTQTPKNGPLSSTQRSGDMLRRSRRSRRRVPPARPPANTSARCSTAPACGPALNSVAGGVSMIALVVWLPGCGTSPAPERAARTVAASRHPLPP